MFNDRYGLTESVLEGRKTMTRRFCKDKDTNEPIFADDVLEPFIYYDGFGNIESITFIMKDGTERISVPKYRVGEVLAIAQCYNDVYEWFFDNEDDDAHIIELETYRGKKSWNNKMFVKADFMPHHIKITDVKLERLQDITVEECMREGVLHSDKYTMPYGIPVPKLPNGVFFFYSTPREAFEALINMVGSKDTWRSNPYVFAYSFELVD